MRLLLVEDDATTAGFIAKGLKEAGMAVDHVADGSQAYAYGLNTFYDLIILDIMLRAATACS